MNRRRNGYTMVEILVAITIIVILVGLVTVGFRRVALGGQQRSTRTTLENCRAMLAEYETKNKISGFAGELPAPGNVTEEGGFAARNGPQVSFTRSVFGRLLGMPENKTAFGQFPPDQILAPSGSTPVGATPWNDGSTYDAFVSIVTYPTVAPKRYICTKDHTATATDAPGMPNAPWVLEDVTSPTVLDAWNNPILFVTSGGLKGVYIKSTSGAAPTLVSPPVKSAPVNPRPFFASAGPDGIFGTMPGPDAAPGTADDIPGGDDNLYSFEN